MVSCGNAPPLAKATTAAFGYARSAQPSINTAARLRTGGRLCTMRYARAAALARRCGPRQHPPKIHRQLRRLHPLRAPPRLPRLLFSARSVALPSCRGSRVGGGLNPSVACCPNKRRACGTSCTDQEKDPPRFRHLSLSFLLPRGIHIASDLNTVCEPWPAQRHEDAATASLYCWMPIWTQNGPGRGSTCISKEPLACLWQHRKTRLVVRVWARRSLLDT